MGVETAVSALLDNKGHSKWGIGNRSVWWVLYNLGGGKVWLVFRGLDNISGCFLCWIVGTADTWWQLFALTGCLGVVVVV